MTATDASTAAPTTNGANLLVDALQNNGIETIYGLVGIPVTDFARLAQSRGMRYIGFRHEASAGNAAAIAGFLTGKPGVCLTVSAPGFLNGLVSLAAATVNCFPMIQISGSSDRHIIDLQRGDYEELDQLATAKPLVKAAYRIDRPEDVGLGVARAIRTAVSGRPGGVYLDVPADVLSAALDADQGARSIITLVDPAPAQLPAPSAVDRALEVLRSAEKPLLVIGKGAAYAQADEAITTFVESTGIPFLPMSMAKGLIPDGHPQSAAAARSLAMTNADVVVLLGARLNWLLSHGNSPKWNADATFVQVDISATEIDSNQPIAAPLVGDIASVVGLLNDRLAKEPWTVPQQWRDQLAEKTATNVAKMATRLDAPHSPMGFYGALKVLKQVFQDFPETYLVNEGANTLDMTRDIVDMHKPRHRLDTGTWGVMGVGMGYAIAAAVETGQPVIAVEGDSAFGFSGMELETICRYKLPIITIIFNNGGIYKGDYVNNASSDPGPTVLDASAHYEKLIEAFDGTGYYATTPQELDDAVRAALAAGTPAVINAVIDPTVGTESGHLTSLNPSVTIAAPPHQ
ncbi:oxalyl-CoA decarboxylase [Branchiibius hedensis]|uniref:Oxalyl-CoA decarboxylase n=1 Tax=Branchiibius hedensis TaxID=672460 RepID=A0A2Y9A191_9MICO|nr:oxalyl-CoA decarboxylase [Branchiibius hedensis]PWJ27449.1 oxalyl-CoA decarboxylase [Branchiibius hedensis]SSA36259.1 oxalyl-CoA decarboxylase [Branchiibius hedensis]